MDFAELVANSLTGLLGTYFLYALVTTFIPIKQNRFLEFLFFSVLFFAIVSPLYPNDWINASAICLLLFLSFLCFLNGPSIHKISLVLALFPFILALNFLLEDIGLRIWLAADQNLALDYFLHGAAQLLRGLVWFGMYRFFRDATPYAKTQIITKLWLILDLICLTPLLAMISLIFFAPSDTRMIYPASFACILTSICCLYLTGYIAKSFRYKLENQNLQLQKEYYKELETNQKELRKIHHDMNNHFSVLLQLANEEQSEKTEEYLNELIGQHTLSNRIFCQNNIVNAVLNAKYQIIQQAQINCSIQLDIDTLLTIDDISLCSLFGNTLDNAIEAAEQAPHKEILVKARYYNGIFSYEIKNTKRHPIKKKGDRFFSTKAKPQEHGIGLQTVKTIVESYHGTLDITYEDDLFSLVVLISDI